MNKIFFFTYIAFCFAMIICPQLSAENKTAEENLILPLAPQSSDGFKGQTIDSFSPSADKKFSSEMLNFNRKNSSAKEDLKKRQPQSVSKKSSTAKKVKGPNRTKKPRKPKK